MSKHLKIDIPSGRDFRHFYIVDLEDARWANAVPFEKYNYIEEYRAICSYEENLIVASIEPLDDPLNSWEKSEIANKTLSVILGKSIEKGKKEKVIIKGEGQYIGKNILIQHAEIDMKLMCRQYNLEMRIEGISIRTNKEAADTLKKISDSIFLQIEAESGVSLALSRVKTPRKEPGRQQQTERKDYINFQNYSTAWMQ